MIGVATLVGIVAAVLTLQLLRSTLEEQMRTQLRQQLEIAASSRAGDAIEAAIGWADHTGTLYAVIDADGEVSGTAAPYITDELVEQLNDSAAVSARQFRLREPVILEGQQVGEGALVLARSDLVLNEASRGLVLRIMPVLLLGILGAVAGGALLARRITKPLVVTAAAAARIAGGERGVPVPHPDVPEVRAVADALATLDRALTTSEQRQREFLLSISHEIRTPLTAIRGYGEALSDEVLPAATAGDVIQAEADRLSRFLDDLLELARLEADEFTITEAEADLRDVLLAAERAWRARASVLDVRIALDLPPDAVEMHLDLVRVRQVVDGLIENALRISPTGSTVTLALRLADGEARISVQDQGPGLSDDDLAHAFERGVLRDRYQHSRPVGTGLGMSIATRLVERIGGTMHASRRASGGTEFTVVWVREQPAEP